jgi:hypothetical protein
VRAIVSELVNGAKDFAAAVLDEVAAVLDAAADRRVTCDV